MQMLSYKLGHKSSSLKHSKEINITETWIDKTNSTVATNPMILGTFLFKKFNVFVLLFSMVLA